jgi:3-isopropylmalate/(R)-2-methylmalate dehydratase small subunit
MMQAFTVVAGRAAPLLMPNIDTDTIVRVEVISRSPEELAPYAFEALRYLPDGTENRDFVLNQPPFRGAPILLGGPNFGCGSSRERAVWSLLGIGVRCIIAPSFGEIFFANCFRNGLLPVVLNEEALRNLASQAQEGAAFTVDLTARTISTSLGARLEFEVDEMRRQCLLQGLDEIEMTLKDEPLIDAWQAVDRTARPWVWEAIGEAAQR